MVDATSPHPHLLPGEPRGRQADHPLPGPPGRLLVQAARLVTQGPAVTAGYVELHAKSFYSFGMGASHAHEMLPKAVEHLGIPP